MNTELLTMGYFLGTVVLIAVGHGIAYLVSQPSKRELSEEIEYLKRVREKDAKMFCQDIERHKACNAELEKAVAFYKAEAGYYKGQAEKNLELLKRATGISEDNLPPAEAGAPFTQRGQVNGGK